MILSKDLEHTDVKLMGLYIVKGIRVDSTFVQWHDIGISPISRDRHCSK